MEHSVLIAQLVVVGRPHPMAFVLHVCRAFIILLDNASPAHIHALCAMIMVHVHYVDSHTHKLQSMANASHAPLNIA